MNKPLLNLFNQNKYTTDKNDLGYIDNFYEEFLGELREIPIIMLEIGVDFGGSTRLWKDYIHEDSTIYAGDVKYFQPIEGVISILGDMYSDTEVSKFPDDYFDLIIDDGPHTFESFTTLQQKYFSKIKPGGKLVIEDIIDSSWVTPLVELSKSLGYSSCEVVDMTGKQKTPQLLERWSNGLYILSIVK